MLWYKCWQKYSYSQSPNIKLFNFGTWSFPNSMVGSMVILARLVQKIISKLCLKVQKMMMICFSFDFHNLHSKKEYRIKWLEEYRFVWVCKKLRQQSRFEFEILFEFLMYFHFAISQRYCFEVLRIRAKNFGDGCFAVIGPGRSAKVSLSSTIPTGKSPFEEIPGIVTLLRGNLSKGLSCIGLPCYVPQKLAIVRFRPTLNTKVNWV